MITELNFPVKLQVEFANKNINILFAEVMVYERTDSNFPVKFANQNLKKKKTFACTPSYLQNRQIKTCPLARGVIWSVMTCYLSHVPSKYQSLFNTSS